MAPKGHVWVVLSFNCLELIVVGAPVPGGWIVHVVGALREVRVVPEAVETLSLAFAQRRSYVMDQSFPESWRDRDVRVLGRSFVPGYVLVKLKLGASI